MLLEDYLEALKNCQDDKLTQELGIFDNWPIFLNGNFDTVVRLLLESSKYILQKTLGSSKYVNHLFDYVPGIVTLQVSNWVAGSFCRGSEQGKQRQARDYNMSIMLHPYQKKEGFKAHQARALANVVIDLAELIKREKINACFPKSIGWNNLEDFSRIVYYP